MCVYVCVSSLYVCVCVCAVRAAERRERSAVSKTRTALPNGHITGVNWVWQQGVAATGAAAGPGLTSARFNFFPPFLFHRSA